MPKMDPMLLRKAVRSGSPKLVSNLVGKLGPHDLALLLTELPPAEKRTVVRLLVNDRHLTATLQAIPDDLLPEFVSDLEDSLVLELINSLDVDDGARLFNALPEEMGQRLLTTADQRVASQIRQLLQHPPESAGALMNPRALSVPVTATVGEAVAIVREVDKDVPVFYLYVVDDQHHLVGVISLAKLVRASTESPVEELMDVDLLTVSPKDDQEAVALLVSRRNLLAVPVVEGGRLVGVVTVDDVIGVLEKEATEDMYNIAGLDEGDRVFSPPHRSLFKRLPWTAVNLVTSLMTAVVVALFEGTISQLVVLATFIPLVLQIGGNAGNQTLTVIIRGITLGELEFSGALRALLKETVVGLGLGLLLGVGVGTVALLWKGSLAFGVVIATAMVLTLLFAALVGTAIPLTLRRLGMDPALGGSILVTMFVDIMGVVFFLGLAHLSLSHIV